MGDGANVQDGVYEFSHNEVANAVGCLSNDRAPGMDGITNEMIEHVAKAAPFLVKSMYDSCLKKGIFPNR